MGQKVSGAEQRNEAQDEQHLEQLRSGGRESHRSCLFSASSAGTVAAMTRRMHCRHSGHLPADLTGRKAHARRDALAAAGEEAGHGCSRQCAPHVRLYPAPSLHSHRFGAGA